MKTQSKILILILSLSFFSCGKTFRTDDSHLNSPKLQGGSTKNGGIPQYKMPEGPSDFKPNDPPLSGDPKDAEQMANKDYLFENDVQKFRMQELGHLVWASFRCKADLKGETNTEPGEFTISFKPQLSIIWKANTNAAPKTIVSKEEVCGEKVEMNRGKKSILGSLSKDQEKNQYVLNLNLDSADPIMLSMKWDADQAKPGDFICRTASLHTLYKAVIKSCDLIPAK